jgi:hypothetical protein
MSFTLGGEGSILPPRKKREAAGVHSTVDASIVNARAAQLTEASKVVRDIDAGMNPKIIGAAVERAPTVLPPDISPEARRIARAPAVGEKEQVRKAIAESAGVVIPLRNINRIPKIDLAQKVTTGELFQQNDVTLISADQSTPVDGRVPVAGPAMNPRMLTNGTLAGLGADPAASGGGMNMWLAIGGIALAFIIGKSMSGAGGEPQLVRLDGDEDEGDEE